MKAMVLAAGLGTRLRPLTDDRPKALVEIDGRTLLEITLMRLRQLGVTEVIINAHHFADKAAYFLRSRNFGMRIEISQEDVLLDTGGGLKKAAWFFLDGTRSDAPFILHNVDVISTIDLPKMIEVHRSQMALATLAVQQRKSSRYLLFDNDGRLCGRVHGSEREQVTDGTDLTELAFCGIHVISPRFLEMIEEHGVFSILKPYVRLAAQGEHIAAFRADEYYWRDLGKPENLAQAGEDLKSGLWKI